jgi:2-amino-4-hydroxy-6-hydroxymethyldihydropteridine diphosphokinase
VKNFNKIILSIGSNVGNRQQNIEKSLKELSRISQIKKVSSIYDSEAILFEEQENFFNLVVEVEYKKTPQSLLKDIKKIEKLIGRKETFRYGPRVIDIDIIFFNKTEVQDKELIIPHYDWQNRRFIIEPLAELFTEFKLLDYKINDQKLVKVGTINYK